MAVIKSGATTDQLTVDPASKAARVTFYDSSGNVISPLQTDGQIKEHPADLCQSVTAVAGAALTVTLPAVASLFHWLTLIEINKYATLAITGIATPVVVTSTNLPGGLAWTFDTAQAIGTLLPKVFMPTAALKSVAANTPTTIVCPAITSVIWRVNVFYYAA